MTDKEIRRLSKTELLSIIRDQEQELWQRKDQMEELRRELADKKTHLEKCGSIAEASLQISHVFQAAQEAADQYLTEIREKKEAADREAGELLAEAKRKADAQLRDSMETRKRVEEDSARKADSCWEELQKKLEDFYQSHKGLQETLESCGVAIRMPNTGVIQENDKAGDTAPKPGGSEPGTGAPR